MVKLNELALENITGGKESKIPQSVKDFAKGLKIVYSAPYVYAHDIVVPEEKRIVKGNTRSSSAGALTMLTCLSVATVTLYECKKILRRKNKGIK